MCSRRGKQPISSSIGKRIRLNSSLLLNLKQILSHSSMFSSSKINSNSRHMLPKAKSKTGNKLSSKLGMIKISSPPTQRVRTKTSPRISSRLGQNRTSNKPGAIQTSSKPGKILTHNKHGQTPTNSKTGPTKIKPPTTMNTTSNTKTTLIKTIKITTKIRTQANSSSITMTIKHITMSNMLIQATNSSSMVTLARINSIMTSNSNMGIKTSMDKSSNTQVIRVNSRIRCSRPSQRTLHRHWRSITKCWIAELFNF